MAKDFSSWLESEVNGDYSQGNLRSVHDKIKEARRLEKNPNRLNALKAMDTALESAVESHVYSKTPELQKLDPTGLV